MLLLVIHTQGARAERRLSAIQNLLLDEESGGGAVDGGSDVDGAHSHELGTQGRGYGYGGVATHQRQALQAGPRGDAHTQLLVPAPSQTHAQPFANAFNSNSAPSSPQKASSVSFNSGGAGLGSNNNKAKRNSKSSRATTQSGSAAHSNSDL